MGQFKYKAFISYSHKDEGWASWLHRKLETYRLPKKAIGRRTEMGHVPERFRPVFRDREELSAGADLGEKIEAALRASETLIVICSPNAVSSNWVNQEIQYFKRYNDPKRIFALVIDGEPYSAESECFPEFLRFNLNETGGLSSAPAEPLAADIRPEADGKRLGFLKLVSGLAGLGLDDLVQRDLQRARKRVTWITLTALTAVISLSSLTWVALNSQRVAEAERDRAEGLIEFMLTDFREKLEPLGQLDVLQDVGRKADEYYSDTKRDKPDELGRKAKAYHLLSEISIAMGDIDQAEIYALKADDITSVQIKLYPFNPERIFEHAHTAYWKSMPFRKREGENLNALPHREEYLRLTQKLHAIESETFRGLNELAYGYAGVGDIFYTEAARFGSKRESENYDIVKSRLNAAKALKQFEQAKIYREQLINLFPNNIEALLNYDNIQAKIASTHWYLGNFEKTAGIRLDKFQSIKRLSEEYPDNYLVMDRLSTSQFGVGNAYFGLNDYGAAEKWYSECIKTVEELLEREPDNVIFQARLKKYRDQYKNNKDSMIKKQNLPIGRQ